MKSYYVVLWMPTVTHNNFEYRYIPETEVFETSDGLDRKELKDKDSSLYAKITIDVNRNFEVLVYSDKVGEEVLKDECFVLKYIEHSHNGLFKFSMEIPDTGNALIKIDKNGKPVFPCDIYNKMKEFYHRHSYHTVDDGDSTLKPYLSEKDVDIKKENNEALKHYLCQYEKKFTNSFGLLSNLYDKLIKKNRWSVYLKLILGEDKHSSFYQMSTAMKGDMTYCNTLLNSCYNKFESVCNTEEVKNARRRTFNIKNITKGVDTMVERVNNHFSVSTAMISLWIALFAIVLSFLFFVLSVNQNFITQ